MFLIGKSIPNYFTTGEAANVKFLKKFKESKNITTDLVLLEVKKLDKPLMRSGGDCASK